MSLYHLPLTLKEANNFVLGHHRHCKPVVGHRFSIGAYVAGALVGVAIVGRPVARELDGQGAAEVNRLATSGYPNACSYLYGVSSRVWRAMGGVLLVTYTRADEPGGSLRAAGWVETAKVNAHSWRCAARPRARQQELIPKRRWEPQWCSQRLASRVARGEVG